MKKQEPVLRHVGRTETPTIEIPPGQLGYPGIRGEIHVLALMQGEDGSKDEEKLHDTSERKFIVSALLSKTPYSTNLNGHISGAFTKDDGHSYLSMEHEKLQVKIPTSELAYHQFMVEKNKDGECSYISFNCLTTDIPNARAIFFSAVGLFLDHLSYCFNIPLFFTSVRIEDQKNKRITIEYIAPYQNQIFGSISNDLHIEMKPIYAMYREAKNSNSHYYRFLCYYKILEGIFNSLRPEIRKKAKEKNIEIQTMDETVPSHPQIPNVFGPYVGKSVGKFFNEVLASQYRDAVAHFRDKDKSVILQASDSRHMDQYENLNLITELCVRQAIAIHESTLAQVLP